MEQNNVLLPGFQCPSFYDTQAGAVMEDGVTMKLLSDLNFEKKYVLLFFLPMNRPEDFSELMAFKGNLESFAKNDCQVVGVTCDSLITIKSWTKLEPSQGGIGGPVNFPIISDNRLDVAKMFGVKGSSGMPVRATFILDKNRNVRHSSVYPRTVGRSVEEVLRTVQAIKETDQLAGEENEVCTPPGWKEGDDLIVNTAEGKREYNSKRISKDGTSTNQVEEGDDETCLEHGIKVLAAIEKEEKTVIVVGEDHTLLAGDRISLNGQVTEVKGYPSQLMFSVSPAVKASKGDEFTLEGRAYHPQEELNIEELKDSGYNWDSELEWLNDYFKFLAKKKKLCVK